MSNETQTVPVEVIDPMKPTNGRKLKYPTPELLQKAVDNFFETEKFPTLTGLGRAIGLSRSSVFDYKQREDFSHIIRDAAERVMEIYEKRAVYGNGKNQAALIHLLKTMGVREPDPTGGKGTIDEEQASSFTEKIREVNQLYLKKK